MRTHHYLKMKTQRVQQTLSYLSCIKSLVRATNTHTYTHIHTHTQSQTHTHTHAHTHTHTHITHLCSRLLPGTLPAGRLPASISCLSHSKHAGVAILGSTGACVFMCVHVCVCVCMCKCLSVCVCTCVRTCTPYASRVGQNHTHMYIRCICGVPSREITIHTVIYDVLMQF